MKIKKYCVRNRYFRKKNKKMTVRELIEDLSKAEPASDVKILDKYDEERPICSVETYKYEVIIVEG